LVGRVRPLRLAGHTDAVFIPRERLAGTHISWIGVSSARA
jgi:hypothetical protein